MDILRNAAFRRQQPRQVRTICYRLKAAFQEAVRKSLVWGFGSILAAVFSTGLLPACAFGAASSPADQNWGQWRGPSANGVSPSANPPVSWSETKNIKWKVKVPGTGSATPIVWANQVFIQTAIPTGKPGAGAARTPAAPPGGRGGMTETPTQIYQFVLLCLDRANGKTLWQKTVREELPHEGARPNDGTYASASPVTDGKHVFAFFGSRGLHCFDLQGNLKWEKDLGKMRIKLGFGEGSSPALSGNTIVVNWDHEGGSFIVAFDTETGRELWRQPREEGTTWATPLIVDYAGKSQVITDGSRKIRSYDLASGKLIWECAGLSQNVIPSPVSADGVVYCLSGFQGNALLAIELSATGDVTGTDAIVWKYGKSTPYTPSPLLYGNRLYFLSGNTEILSCFDAKTGHPLIDAERSGIGDIYASPVGAAGRVYLVSRAGKAVVLKDADKFEVLARNQLDEGFDASPALAGNELFLRGHEYVYCIAEP